MTTRAAINILGSTGEIIDITSLGVNTITAEHPGVGQYLIHGTLGMEPPPLGWGYVVNQMDSGLAISIAFDGNVLTVNTTADGQPSDLQHSITLHIKVDELPPVDIHEPVPPVSTPIDLVAQAVSEAARLRAIADYAVVPLQDAFDIDEATDTDVILLKAWKKYRVALNKVPDQVGYAEVITWPVAPA